MNRDEEWHDEEGEETPLIVPIVASPVDHENRHHNDNDNDNTAAANHHRRVQSLDVKSMQAMRPNYRGTNAKRSRHRRNRTSLGEMFQSMSHGLGTISEEIIIEARAVQQSFQEELREAESGRKYFLDMSLTRTLSVIPDQLSDMVQEVTGRSVRDFERRIRQEAGVAVSMAVADAAKTTEPTAWSSLGPYVSLLAAVVAVSSGGAATSLLHGVPPPLKLFWRMTANTMAFGIFAFPSFYRLGWPKLSSAQWLTLLAGSFCWTAHALLVIFAYDYTSIGNVVIGANSQALILLIAKVFVGEELAVLEAIGVVVAFAGCVLCASDEAKDPDNDVDGRRALFGDGLALISAFFGVGYLTFAKAVRSHLAVFVFMFLVQMCGCFMVLGFMAAVNDERLSPSNDPFKGLFGWMNLAEHRIFIIIYLALICQVVGSAGFIRAMAYFENIIIAVATLLEPITATLIAVALNVGELPGTNGWIGNLLVILGTLGVVYPSASKGGGASH